MALLKSRSRDIPEGAVKLSEDEAFVYHMKIVTNWKDSADVFAIRHGPYFLAGASFLVGAYFNSYYRGRFRLRSYGQFSTYLPVTVVPAALTLLLHSEMVSKPLVLMKWDTCPVCLELRASAIQSFVGCALPFVLAPIMSISLVHRYFTYDMPFLTQNPRKVWEVYMKLTKPIKGRVFALFLLQAAFAMTITQFEANSMLKVHKKFLEMERLAESGQVN